MILGNAVDLFPWLAQSWSPLAPYAAPAAPSAKGLGISRDIVA